MSLGVNLLALFSESHLGIREIQAQCVTLLHIQADRVHWLNPNFS